MRSVKCIGILACIHLLGFLAENVCLIQTWIPTYQIQNHQTYTHSWRFFLLIENLTYRCSTYQGIPVSRTFRSLQIRRNPDFNLTSHPQTVRKHARNTSLGAQNHSTFAMVKYFGYWRLSRKRLFQKRLNTVQTRLGFADVRTKQSLSKPREHATASECFSCCLKHIRRI